MYSDAQRAGVERTKTQSVSSCDNVTPLHNCRKYDDKRRHTNLVTGVLKVSAGAFPKIEMAMHTNQQEVQGAENKSQLKCHSYESKHCMQFVSNSRNKKMNMMMNMIKSAMMNKMMNMMLMHSER